MEEKEEISQSQSISTLSLYCSGPLTGGRSPLLGHEPPGPGVSSGPQCSSDLPPPPRLQKRNRAHLY